MELLTSAVRCMDILYWVNKKFKLSTERIEEKEF